MNIYVHDIEVAPNLFTVTILDYNNCEQVYQFEISSRKNDYLMIYNFYVNNPMFLVGFNSKHYDDVIIFMLIKNFSKYKNNNSEKICDAIFQLSEDIIKEHYEAYKAYKYPPRNVQITQVDLFLYWTQLIRRSKQISLKTAAAFLKADNIQDLPFQPGIKIDESQIDSVLEYNLNDVKVTYTLAKAMKQDINLKFQVSKKYNKNYMSSDGVNMGLDVLKEEYAKSINVSASKVVPKILTHNYVDGKKLINHKVNFKTKEFQQVLNDLLNSRISLVKDNNENSWSFKQMFKDNLFVFGVGGLHTKDKSAVIKPLLNGEIWAVDATSYYPHLTFVYNFYPSHLNSTFVKLYKEKYITRVEAKKRAKKALKEGNVDSEAEMLNDLYKLLLNGYTGNLKSAYAWVYDPVANLKITINGQLFLTMLAEEFELQGVKVISVNTDGVEVHVLNHQHETVKQIIKWWEDLIEIPLETEKYNLIVREDVNSYFAITQEGKIKEKGRLMKNPQLFFFHSSNNLVIPKAVQAYFIKNIDPVAFITNHKNIFDFCNTPKVSKKYEVYWDDKKQQRTNRFYASTDGKFLYKKKLDTGRLANMLKDVPVTLYNKHTNVFPNNINYQYYISRVEELLNKIEPKQLILF